MGSEKPVLVKLLIFRPQKRAFIREFKPEDGEDLGYSWPPRWRSLDMQGDELFILAELNAVNDEEVLDKLGYADEVNSCSCYVPLNLANLGEDA